MDNGLPKQKVTSPAAPVSSTRLSSTPTKDNNANLDFSTNLSPIHPRASTPTSRTAMDLYAIIHESKKKIMKLRERNSSPTLSEKVNRNQQTPTEPIPVRQMAESHNIGSNKVNLPISENVLKMNSNARSSPSEMSLKQSFNPIQKINEKRLKNTLPSTQERIVQSGPEMVAPTPERIQNVQKNLRDSPCSAISTPERIFTDRVAKTAPGSGNSTPERMLVEKNLRNSPCSLNSNLERVFTERIARTAPGSGSSTPERNFRVISEGPNWPKAIPASHVPNLRSSPSPTYDYLNLSPSGHYQKNRSPSPLLDNQYPSYPDYRSLPRMGRDSPKNCSTNFLPQSPARQHVFAPRESLTWDRRMHSPQHSSFASDRHGRTQPTSRNDFKQLLLRANWGTATSTGSAVERLKNRTSPIKNKSWKSDILSSTIPEDCREDDEQSDRKTPDRNSGTYTEGVPKSSALVSQQCKMFDNNRVSPTEKNRNSPTLETAL
ncbi:hypothetical protein J6590_048362 [Homalodisca vitripennis]|nr:hypothetical protein J6590_048362 [Homalodisca vitripennis]